MENIQTTSADDNEYKVSIDEQTNFLISQTQWINTKINGLNQNATTNSNSSMIEEYAVNIDDSTSTATPIHIPQTVPIQQIKHIMISYNQATSSIVCQKIYDRLKERNYKVWFDKIDLHGDILDGMAEAVENAYILLLCMNDRYSESPFCRAEAKYAFENKVPIIPCMMDEAFRPRSGLGLIKGSLKHIDFYDENEFDEKFEALIDEIKAIEAGLGMRMISDNNINFQEQFFAFISEHIESIRNCHLRRGNLDDNEFGTVLRKLIERFSPETLQSFRNNQSDSADEQQTHENENDRLIEYLLENDQKLAELVRNQQDNFERAQQHFIDQDERLKAFICFQEKNNVDLRQRYLNQNERLASLFRVQEEYQQNCDNLQRHFSINNEQLRIRQQEQERNNHTSQQLLRQIEQLTQLIFRQNEQHARETEALRQLINQTVERSSNTQQRHEFHFDFDVFDKLVQTLLLLCTLFILLQEIK